MSNRLSDATSPYLQQHATNPVHWWQWGPEAFAEARRRDVPVFVSIGYAACHWCHVMAHESFDDEATAEQLNADFVAVKVDREERPDVDAVYMDATVGMTGQGGWPMSVFCTPEGEPFYCGTYYPPASRGGLPGFRDVLSAISRTWVERRDSITSVGTAAVKVIGDHDRRRGTAQPADRSLVITAAQHALDSYDLHQGGVGAAPKFPVPVLHRGMLDAAYLADAALRDKVRHAVDISIDAMAAGGIHDHLAGGFARYCVDGHWTVPHFEKMLYDNALLLRLYAQRALEERQQGHDARADHLLGVCRAITAWLDAELDTGRGYASSLDADSVDTHGQLTEGAAYVWTPQQLRDALGDREGQEVARAFSVTDGGNFDHGTSTLRRPLSAPWPPAQWWPAAQEQLLELRRGRPAPARDDKIVTEWNGLAITGIVAFARATVDAGEREQLLARATGLAHTMCPDPGEPLRRSRLGERVSCAPAGLADYAALATGCALVASETGTAELANMARELVETALATFAVENTPGRWYDAVDDEILPVRPSDITDGATPSGSSQLTEALLLLSVMVDPTRAARYRELALASLDDAGGLVAAAPTQAGGWLSANQLAVAGPATVTVLGHASAHTLSALRAVIPPNVVLIHGELLEMERENTDGDNQGAHNGDPDAQKLQFLACRAGRCSLPTSDIADLPGLLAGA